MLELINVVKEFKTKDGIHGISFKIPDNSITAFVGDNGAGKTTTIKSIFGQNKLQDGEILLDGKNIFKESKLMELAFFPDSNNIPLNLKLMEYINYIFVLYKIDKSKLEIVDRILNNFGILDCKNKKIKKLSAGQKKKAIMTGVLIRSPKYIILDEPTANLDVATKNEFIKILSDLNKEGVTIFITSHLIEELQQIATNLILIDNGRIVYDKPFNGATENINVIYKSLSSRNKKESDSISISELYEKK